MGVISVVPEFQKISNELSPANIVGNTRWPTTHNATMYIFRPHQVPDTTVRPFQFSFDTEFIEDLSRVVQDAGAQISGSVGGNFTMNAKLPGIESANRAVTPSTAGLKFFGSSMDGLYTFVLVIDNDSFRGRFGETKLMNRLLYMGVFLDEPYSNLNGNIVFNERCLALPTHFTQINVQPVTDAYGGSIIRVQPMHDTDIVHPQQMLQVSRNREYLLRPEDLTDSVGYDSAGVSYSSPHQGYLGNRAESVRLNTLLNNPKEQLGKVVTGLAQTIQSMQLSDRLPAQVDVFNTHIQDDFTIFNNFKNNVKEELPNRMLGIRVDQPILLSEVLSQYPTLYDNTQILDVPFNLPTDPMDTEAPTAHNVWVSLLTSCIPAVFGTFGISDAAFRYCSTNPCAISTFDRHSIYELQHILTFVPQEDESIIHNRWIRALDYLETYIFPIITTQVGNFDVMVTYRSAGECMIQLQLMDCYDTPNDGVVITNGLFGGFQSPLVGNLAIKTTNSSEVSSAVQHLTSIATVDVLH